jgi:uncharacterized membrane protein
MKLLRFAVPALGAVGLAACGYASARLIGWVPQGKLALYPLWAGVHFGSAALFALIAPLQLWPQLRVRRPDLHRALGRVGVAVGAVMALSGLPLAYTAPDRPVSEVIFMTTFFLAYLTLLTLGLRAALARDFAAHRGWMARMTATALTPVTQRLLFPPLAAAIGIDGMATFWQLFVSAAWLAWGLNMGIAEVWLGTSGLLRPDAQPPRRRA